MNLKHLIWIIPVVLIVGGLIGLVIGIRVMDISKNIITEGCELSMTILTDVMNQDEDCRILAMGYAQKYKSNFTEKILQ